jgi:hypothetical protein
MPRDDDDDDLDDAPDGEEETGIEVSTSFFPLVWVLFLCTPCISINGKVKPRKWGRHFFGVKPGKYLIECWVPYLFASKLGWSKRQVKVYPGEVTKVSWYFMGFFLFPGTFTVTDGASRASSGRKGKRRDDDEDDD